MYRILYVDDEPDLLEIAKIFLEHDGEITVDTRNSAIPALPLLDSRQHDAVISDYQMPDMDGIEFLKKVRASGNNIPFILFTGKGREEVVIQALNEGADFYLQKGGDPDSQFAELSNKIRYAINSKRAEETLKDKTTELDRFFNNSPDLLCIADTNGYFHRLNPEWEHALGYTISELEGKKFLDFVHLDDLTQTIHAISALQGKKEVLNFENRYRHKDGSYRWIEWRSYQYGNFIYAAARDITDRKRAEEILRESEERLRLFIQHAPAALAMLDKELRYIAASRRWRADYYLGDRDLIGHSHYEIFPELTEEIRDVLRRGLAGEITSANEDKFERQDGSVQWLAWEVRPWYTTGNNIGGVIIYSEDITQRKKAEEALILEKTFIDAIFNSVPGMLYLYDADGHLIRWNKKHELMTGYTSEELSRMQLFDWYKGDEKSQNAVTEGVKTTMQTGFGEAEADLQTKDGTKIPMYFTASPLSIEGKQYFAGIGIEITDRKRVEDNLRQKNEELGAAYEQIAASEEEIRENLDELTASQHELRKSERKYRDLFDNAILGIFRSTPDGHYLDVNPAFAKIAGFASPQEMMEVVRDIQQLYARPEERLRLKEMLATTGEIHNFETEIHRRDGATIWISINAKTARDSSGNILWYDGTIEDITTRRKAELELARGN
ncbi:MAG: PAS domain S-box protein [Methanoregula sp.]